MKAPPRKTTPPYPEGRENVTGQKTRWAVNQHEVNHNMRGEHFDSEQAARECAAKHVEANDPALASVEIVKSTYVDGMLTGDEQVEEWVLRPAQPERRLPPEQPLIFTDQHGRKWEYTRFESPTWGPAYAFLLDVAGELRYMSTLRNEDGEYAVSICEYIHKTTFQIIAVDEDGRAYTVEEPDQTRKTDRRLVVTEVDFAEARARLTQPK
jgi:predicted  nucleic acid-binding Zn-ribbon protein